jgi:hypothetical protein
VFILTDGHPAPEGQNVLRDEIISCKQMLEAKGYDPTSVLFCINQMPVIGTSRTTKQFIDSLRNEKAIEEETYCTVGRLDDKYEELKENERALELWLLDLLTEAIVHRFVPKPFFTINVSLSLTIAIVTNSTILTYGIKGKKPTYKQYK